ncbi:MAG: hypothetical protein SGPRY_014907, partial [Prymnesium sp.]
QIDPCSLSTEPPHRAQLLKLDFFSQLDAVVNHAGKPDIKNIPVFVLGALWCAFHCVVCTRLSLIQGELGSDGFHAALLKNLIAYDSLANQNGFAMMYFLLSSREYRLKYKVGTVKEPFFTWMPTTRSPLDVTLNLAFAFSRVWMLYEADPSPACASFYLCCTIWQLLFDYTEYVGGYGMYHGPWSVFLFAKYAMGGGRAANALLQWLLLLLYVGCGLGKMGPWFTCVFNQEWTLPPWARVVRLGRFLYRNSFPRDNTPSTLGTLLSYAAATSEWLAPMLLLLSPHVVGGEVGSLTTPVWLGLTTILAMHAYIVLHMPTFDVWMLNLTPAYLSYHTFYRSPLLPSPGFDFEGLCSLHPALLAFCGLMAAFCLYGQLKPEKVCYMACYRFWAGNWPQSYVILSPAALEKLRTGFPREVEGGLPGAAFKKLQGDLWAVNYFGILQTGQLPHRILPHAMYKALSLGAEMRGENPPTSLAQFVLEGSCVCPAVFMACWVSGWVVNDALRAPHVFEEMHKRCGFKPGEFMLVMSHSFPLLAGVTGAPSRWSITDADRGLLAEGWITPSEACTITCPSVLRDYEKTGIAVASEKKSM